MLLLLLGDDDDGGSLLVMILCKKCGGLQLNNFGLVECLIFGWVIFCDSRLCQPQRFHPPFKMWAMGGLGRPLLL